MLEKKLFFNEAIILRRLAAVLAKIILGEKKKPIIMLERVQSIMTYKRIKTETTFQYSLLGMFAVVHSLLGFVFTMCSCM